MADSMMQTKRYNDLLLASLQHAEGAVGSDELLDIVTGLAESEGWTRADLAGLTRKSIAQRLMHLEHTGEVRRVGSYIDEHRRPSPRYVPARVNPIPIPEPPPKPTPAEHAALADARAVRALADNPVFLSKLGELLLSFSDDLARKCR